MQLSHLGDVWTDEPVDALAWFEGLQLLPQHFQQWDRRIERAIWRHANSGLTWRWGIDRIEWNTEALARGALQVVRAQGLFPDGLVFSVQPSEAQALSAELPALAFGERVRYALAIPRQSFIDQGSRVGRFGELRSRLVQDWRDGEDQASVMFETPNITLRAFAHSALYTQLPFIDLERTPNGWMAIPYHPPAVQLMSDSACLHGVKAVSRALRRVLERLQPHVRGRDAVTLAVQGFSALCPRLAALEAMSSSERAHPFQWHMMLSDVAGAVGAATGTLPPVFAAYDHNDPAASLLALAGYITRELAQLGEQELRPLVWDEQPFALEEGQWWCELPAQHRGKIMLRLDFDELNAPARAWIDHTLICPARDVVRCRELRIRGLARRTLETFSHFPSVEGRCYVEVDAPEEDDAFRLMIGAPDRRTGVRLRHVHLLRARGTP